MPGPKMGPRPRDFDEELVRRSPTYRKWEDLLPGGTLRYACREFVKGHGDDEERLMRRIMIARRNNVRDHQALKWARRMQSSGLTKDAEEKTSSVAEQPSSSQSQNNPKESHAIKVKSNNVIESSEKYNIINSRRETEAIISRTAHLLPGEQEPPPGRRSRGPTTLISDEAIKEEMDVHSVELTRSYKTWLSLPNGAEFLYNQKYIKGQEAHDWLLKKNIWRRMRYRRENKKMVEQMLSRERGQSLSIAQQHQSRKRRHDESAISSTCTGAISSTCTGSTTTIIGSNNRNSAVGDLDRILADASPPTMGVNTAIMTTASTTSALGTTTRNETNRQEAVASTASEIVDHALLSTNTGVVVPAPPHVPTENATTVDAITMSIGDHQHQHQQHNQDQYPPTHTLHHQHNHEAAESAAAFAASIALAGVGMGTDGDLNSHHETSVADSAAVEAAVAAALAATDAKSNSYHHHHLSHPSLNHHTDLMDVNHIVHGGNDPLAAPTTAGERGLHSVPPASETSRSSLPMVSTTLNTSQVAPSHSSQGGVARDLGLALDAAAKLAAAAATTCASDEAVLAVTKAINAAAVKKSEPVIGKGSDGGSDENNAEIAERQPDNRTGGLSLSGVVHI